MNRKDAEGKNIFQGGFLGLDNIGVFDRSAPLPTGGYIEQSDGTSWMAMYRLNMLAIALELATEDPAYEDVASKFLEHFLYIAHAMNHRGDDGIGLWDEEDGFFYDVLQLPGRRPVPDARCAPWSGLIPLFAVETLEPELLRPAARLQAAHGVVHRQPARPDRQRRLHADAAAWASDGLLSIVERGPAAPRCSQVHAGREGIPLAVRHSRAFAGITATIPITLDVDGTEHRVDYEPAESTHRTVRRQLQLARADLVSGELSC